MSTARGTKVTSATLAMGCDSVRGLKASNAGNETAGRCGVALVRDAVGGEQVGLLDETHLHLIGDH
jgi:hypothetical protein